MYGHSLDFQLLKLMAKVVSEGADQLLYLTLVMGDSKNLKIVLENSSVLFQVENPETLRIATFKP